MLNNISPVEISLDDVRRKHEEYETTVMAIQAISRIINRFYIESQNSSATKISFGRKMDTSDANKVHPNNFVTPDIVIQFGDSWGMVAEAKRTMPRNHDNQWRNTVSQIEKYDDHLKGWWTGDGYLLESNIVLLIDVDRSIDFSHYLQALINDGQIESFSQPTAIIEFFKKQEVKQFLRIRKVWGTIKPTELQDLLSSGKSISVEGLVDSQKFYDHEPDAVEYTMILLWQTVFTERKVNSIFDEKSKTWLIVVDLDELTDYLQKLYGHRSNEHRERTFPRRQWIKKAVDAFVTLGYATRKDKNTYIIKFKKLTKGDIFEKFYRHRLLESKLKGEKNIEQLALFPDQKRE